MSYATQPRIYPESPFSRQRQQLARLIQRANNAESHDDSLRICFFGDSTYTSPGGFGVSLHHAVTQKLGGLFGNIAGSPDVTPYSNTSGMPYAIRGNNNIKAVSAGWYDGTHAPPNAGAVGLPFGSGEGDHQPGIVFDPASGQSLTELKRYVSGGLFSGTNVKLHFKFMRQVNSATNIKVQFAPRAVPTYNLFASVTATEDFEVVGLDSDPGDKCELVDYITTGRTPDAGEYCQWYIESGEETTAGVGSVAPPVLAMARVLSENPVGPIIDFRGVSGGQSRSILGDSVDGLGGSHGNCMPWLSQLGYDVAVFGFGTNDIFSAGFTAADIRRNYYDPDGAANKGIIGEWVDECRLRGLAVPLFVLSVPPYRADDSSGWSAPKQALYDLIADELIALADELNGIGIDTIVLNKYRITHEMGLNETFNTTTGLTDEGDYSTSSVSYAIGDYYRSPVNNQRYRCIAAHTSSATSIPTSATPAEAVKHMPLNVHLSDGVHRTQAGADLEAQAYEFLFSQSMKIADVRSLTDTEIRQFVRTGKIPV